MFGRAAWSLVAAGFLLASHGISERAQAAEVVISVNKAAQTMSVLIDGAEAHSWVVSTGTGGGPPDGTFRPERLHRHWFSRTFNMAPMPYSIFFQGPYAIHGTDKIAQLGRRASKGCVRLHPRDAAVLFELVQREKANTTIVVSKTTHVAARVTPERADTSAAEAAEKARDKQAVAANAEAIKPAGPLASATERRSVRTVRSRGQRKPTVASPSPAPDYGALQ